MLSKKRIKAMKVASLFYQPNTKENVAKNIKTNLQFYYNQKKNLTEKEKNQEIEDILLEVLQSLRPEEFKSNEDTIPDPLEESYPEMKYPGISDDPWQKHKVAKLKVIRKKSFSHRIKNLLK